MRLTDVVPVDDAVETDGPVADGGSSTSATDGGVLESPVDPVDLEADERTLSVAASAESGSEHPLARAIVEGAEERGLDLETPTAFENVPGHGIRATIPAARCWWATGNSCANTASTSPVEATMERLEYEGRRRCWSHSSVTTVRIASTSYWA